MPQILEQGISIDSHDGNNAQRKQSHRHYNDLNGSRQRQPHQFRITYQAYQSNCLDGISGFHHAAEEFTGVGVVGRDRVDITVFFFFHNGLLRTLFRNPGDVENVIHGNEVLRHILLTDLKNAFGQRFVESVDQICTVFIFPAFTHIQDFTVHEVDAVIGNNHFNTTFHWGIWAVRCPPHCP